MQKNLSSLRPFDPQAWANGDKVCDVTGIPASDCAVAFLAANKGEDSLRMLPLGWIDGYPVYGDHWVYRTAIGDCVQASEMGCPALATAAGNVRWPTKSEIRLAQIADGFIKDCASAVRALRGRLKNLEALRPFDSEAWVKGAKVCTKGGTPVADSAVTFLAANGEEGMLYMAPLSWGLDGEPVYAEETPKAKVIELRIDGKIVDERRVLPRYLAAIALSADGNPLPVREYDYHS